MTTGHQNRHAELGDASVNEAIADWFDDAFRIYGEIVDSQRRLAVALIRAWTPGFGLAERIGDMAERLPSLAVRRAPPGDRATPSPGAAVDAPMRPVSATPSLAADPREDRPATEVNQAGLAGATNAEPDAEPDTERDTSAGAQTAGVSGADDLDQAGRAKPTDDEDPAHDGNLTDTDPHEARTDAEDDPGDTAHHAGVEGAGIDSAADVEAADTSGDDTGKAAPANTHGDETDSEDTAGDTTGMGATAAALNIAADAEAEDMATKAENTETHEARPSMPSPGVPSPGVPSPGVPTPRMPTPGRPTVPAALQRPVAAPRARRGRPGRGRHAATAVLPATSAVAWPVLALGPRAANPPAPARRHAVRPSPPGATPPTARARARPGVPTPGARPPRLGRQEGAAPAPRGSETRGRGVARPPRPVAR